MIYFVLVVLFALSMLFFVAGMLPDDFRYSRSAQMAARPEDVFLHVNTLRLWNAWSPWARLDLNAKTTFEGPESGVGSIMRWDGNKKVGKGSMEITESSVGQRIRFKLVFEKPMQATNHAEFVFKTVEGKTEVTWSMWGKSSFTAKLIGLVMNCEKMVGKQFESGLANLKSVVEPKGAA